MRLSRANMPLASGYGAWCQALSGFHCKNLAPHFPPGFINLQHFCHSRWRNPVRLSKSGLSSCLELTRMWRSTERASLEKKPSMRLSHDPCVGVNVKVKRPMGCAANQLVVSRDTWAEWLSRITSMAVSAG